MCYILYIYIYLLLFLWKTLIQLSDLFSSMTFPVYSASATSHSLLFFRDKCSRPIPPQGLCTSLRCGSLTSSGKAPLISLCKTATCTPLWILTLNSPESPLVLSLSITIYDLLSMHCYVDKKLISSQSKKEMENFTLANLKIITLETVFQKVPRSVNQSEVKE